MKYLQCTVISVCAKSSNPQPGYEVQGSITRLHDNDRLGQAHKGVPVAEKSGQSLSY